MVTPAPAGSRRGRLWVFTGTSRAGSTWLSSVLDRASPVRSEHELLLNHRAVDGVLVREQRTAEGFRELARDGAERRRLIADVRVAVLERGTDLADANPYLAYSLDELIAEVPDATVVHLRRDPWSALRSIVNRQWYDTPLDSWHPDVPVPGWDRMEQLERCAWYVRHTNELLLDRGTPHLRFEAVVNDAGALERALAEHALPLSIQDAVPAMRRRVNENRSWFVPPIVAWREEDRAVVDPILAPVASRLGYDVPPQRPSAAAPHLDRRVAPGRSALVRLSDRGVTARRGRRRAIALDGGRGWMVALATRERLPGPGLLAPWRTRAGAWVHGAVDLELRGGVALLLCISFDRLGRAVAVRRGARWFGDGVREVAIAPRPDASRFALVLVVDGRDQESTCRLLSAELDLVTGWTASVAG